jgi:signal transduction histidine kinase
MAFTSAMLIPPASDIWAPLLRNSIAQVLTWIPLHVWGILSALALMYFVIRALNIFQEERQQTLDELNAQRQEAQRMALMSQVEARRHAENWTNGLVNIGRQIADMDNTDDILTAILKLGRVLLEADTAALAVWDDNGAHLNLRCHITNDGNEFLPGNSVCHPLILECAQYAITRRYPDDAASVNWHCAVTQRDIRAAAIVALQLDRRPLGVIWLERFEPRLFTEDDLLKLSHLADQAVIAIEHALMAARIQSVAILEERSRIAREMHDGLAQILGYLSLELQTLEALTKQDHKDEVLKELQQARQRITMAQADVRESILSLRTTLAGNRGIISTLQQYCEEFEVQTGVEVKFVDATAETVNLSSIAEVQLICIIREAFMNVRKHAQATQVKLELNYNTNWLTATIADNGCGFVIRSSRGHFGLQTMRERAQSVGGDLKIESYPAQGTLVKLRLPLIA